MNQAVVPIRYRGSQKEFTAHRSSSSMSSCNDINFSTATSMVTELDLSAAIDRLVIFWILSSESLTSCRSYTADKLTYFTCVFLVVGPFLLYQGQGYLCRSSSNIMVTFWNKNGPNKGTSVSRIQLVFWHFWTKENYIQYNLYLETAQGK